MGRYGISLPYSRSLVSDLNEIIFQRNREIEVRQTRMLNVREGICSFLSHFKDGYYFFIFVICPEV